jgi:hypothetical protein
MWYKRAVVVWAIAYWMREIEGFKMYKNGDKQNKVIDNKAIKYYNLIK